MKTSHETQPMGNEPFFFYNVLFEDQYPINNSQLPFFKLVTTMSARTKNCSCVHFFQHKHSITIMTAEDRIEWNFVVGFCSLFLVW